MKRLLAIGTVVLLAGCAGNVASIDTGGGVSLSAAGDTQADTTTDFDVKVEQTNAGVAMPTSSNDRTPVAPLDIKYAISITNLTNEPVTLRHITLSTPDGPFVIPTTMRKYKKTIAPGATEMVDFWAQANARDANMGAATPALVRMMIEFDGSQGKHTESFMRNVNGRFSIGVGEIRKTTPDLRVAVEEEAAPVDLPTSVNDDRPILPVDLRYRIAITNTTQEPVTVRQVTLMYEDPGRRIPRVTRNYTKTIAGGATEKIAFWTEMQANDASTWRPAYVYTQIEFEGSQGKRVEYFKSQARPRDYRRASEILR